MKLFSAPSSRAFIVLAVFVALCATGVAVAASSGSTTIHGCYAKKGGDLRRVKSATACKGSEVAISWNKRGPRGPKGDTGAAGSARAYAAVNSDATLDTARSSHITSVENFGTGSYCVFPDSSIDLSTNAAIVSLRGAAGSSDTAIYVSASGCSAGADQGIFVKTTTLAGADKAAAFYLMVP